MLPIFGKSKQEVRVDEPVKPEPLNVAVTPKPLTEMSDSEINEWARMVWEKMTGQKAR